MKYAFSTVLREVNRVWQFKNAFCVVNLGFERTRVEKASRHLKFPLLSLPPFRTPSRRSRKVHLQNCEVEGVSLTPLCALANLKELSVHFIFPFSGNL